MGSHTDAKITRLFLSNETSTNIEYRYSSSHLLALFPSHATIDGAVARLTNQHQERHASNETEDESRHRNMERTPVFRFVVVIVIGVGMTVDYGTRGKRATQTTEQIVDGQCVIRQTLGQVTAGNSVGGGGKRRGRDSEWGRSSRVKKRIDFVARVVNSLLSILCPSSLSDSF